MVKDKVEFNEKVHIVLRGPDGKIKDERLLAKKVKPEVKNAKD